MKTFASDNSSGICAEALEAIQKANQNHALAYGNDSYTNTALALLKDTFGENSSSYFVYNGTAANTLALKAITRSHQAIICADSSHIATQEVGSVINAIGCALLPIANNQGKLNSESIEEVYLKTTFWGKHNNLPKVVSISQTTEYGTVYSLEELQAIANVCRKHNMLFHMDGCRLANAAASLHTSLKALTADVGVDVLSFGATKNGLLFGEAVVFFRKELAQEFEYIQKQNLQLHSKMRFIAAQFIPYLEKKVWQKNAEHANAMCQLLAQGLANRNDIVFAYPVQSNQIFAYFSNALIKETKEAFQYHIWEPATNLARLVTSFDTTTEDVEQFLNLVLATPQQGGHKSRKHLDIMNEV